MSSVVAIWLLLEASGEERCNKLENDEEEGEGGGGGLKLIFIHT